MLLKRVPSNSFDKCGHRAEGQYVIFQREIYSAIRFCSPQSGKLGLNSLQTYTREEYICHKVLRIFLIEISQICRILRPRRITRSCFQQSRAPFSLAHIPPTPFSSPSPSPNLIWLLKLIFKAHIWPNILSPET